MATTKNKKTIEVGNKIQDLLKTRENIEDAFELWLEFSKLVDELHREFWRTLVLKIEKGLKDRGLDGWQVKRDPATADILKAKWFWLIVGQPDGACVFVVEQARDDWEASLYCDIGLRG